MKGEKRMPLGDVVKTYREARGISQNDLAKRAQISQGTLSRIESNIQKPSMRSLIRIAKFLDISIDELIQIGETTDPLTLNQADVEKLPSTFMLRMQQLEQDLTTKQQGILVTIAQALAFETRMKQELSDNPTDEE